MSLNNRAQAHLKLGAYADAITDATAVLARTRGVRGQEALFRKALFRRGFSLREQAVPDVAAALADFQELVAVEPDNKRCVCVCVSVSVSLFLYAYVPLYLSLTTLTSTTTT